MLIFMHGRSGFAFPTFGNEPQGVKEITLPDGKRVKVEPWAEGLEIPWSLIFLPEGKALGRLVHKLCLQMSLINFQIV